MALTGEFPYLLSWDGRVRRDKVVGSRIAAARSLNPTQEIMQLNVKLIISPLVPHFIYAFLSSIIHDLCVLCGLEMLQPNPFPILLEEARRLLHQLRIPNFQAQHIVHFPDPHIPVLSEHIVFTRSRILCADCWPYL